MRNKRFQYRGPSFFSARDSGSVREEDIRQSVAVVVKRSDAAGHRFRKVFPRGCGVIQHETVRTRWGWLSNRIGPPAGLRRRNQPKDAEGRLIPIRTGPGTRPRGNLRPPLTAPVKRFLDCFFRLLDLTPVLALTYAYDGGKGQMNQMPRSLIVFCLILFACVTIVSAQGPVGTLQGTVTDPAGAVVPGATVVAKNQATGVEHNTTTTSSGAYTLPYVPAGTYDIRVTSPGFRTATAENVTLRVAQTQTADIKLEVGAVSEQVVVSGTAELVESGSAEIGHYITTEEYKSWPIVVGDGQRQIQQFIFDSLPGTTGDTFKGSINGGQEYSHEILIEGMPIGRADLSGGNNNEFSPSAEAVGEFKLQTGAITAEYNGGQTAVANFTIRSGTNTPHGSVVLLWTERSLWMPQT